VELGANKNTNYSETAFTLLLCPT